MKIKFNGILEHKGSSGCSACGSKRKSSFGFTTVKSYFLPSGKQQTFKVGEIYTVSDSDGSFLLSYNSAPDVNGLSRKVFEEWTKA